MMQLHNQTMSLEEWRAIWAAKDTSYTDYMRVRRKLEEEARQIDTETIKRYIAEWKLPNVLSPNQIWWLKMPGVNLSKTDKHLFSKIKDLLRRQGEGNVC